MADKKGIHDGHRERLLKTAYEGGFENLSIYQQVEVILFNFFPRGDMNPLAHRLIDEFGSLANILDADVKDIERVQGMGEMTAIKMKVYLQSFQGYSLSKFESKDVLTRKSLNNIIIKSLINTIEEETLIVSVDRKGTLNGFRIIARGTDSSVNIDVKNVYKFIDSYKSVAVYIAHSHPRGTCFPSLSDVETFELLKMKIENYGCRLDDCFVCATDGLYSLTRKEKVVADPREATFE